MARVGKVKPMGLNDLVCRQVETEVRQKCQPKVVRRPYRGKVRGADPDAVDVPLPLDGDRALRQSLLRLAEGQRLGRLM